MKTEAAQWWLPLKSQLEGNLRLQWLLLAIALVCGAQFLTALWEARQQALLEVSRLQSRFALVSNLRDQGEWRDRLLEAERLAGQLDAELQEVASLGIAQATVQTWLQARAAGMDGAPSFTVAPARPVENMPDIVQVTAAVSGRSHRNTVLDLVSRVETSPNLMVVDAMTLNADASTGFSMTISAYFRIAPSVGGEE